MNLVSVTLVFENGCSSNTSNCHFERSESYKRPSVNGLAFSWFRKSLKANLQRTHAHHLPGNWTDPGRGCPAGGAGGHRCRKTVDWTAFCSRPSSSSCCLPNATFSPCSLASVGCLLELLEEPAQTPAPYTARHYGASRYQSVDSKELLHDPAESHPRPSICTCSECMET